MIDYFVQFYDFIQHLMPLTSDERFVNRIRSRIGKVIHTYDLVGPDDRVLVAISGGKDSLAMLEILAWRKKILSAPAVIHAAYVKVQEIPYEADENYLHSFCESLSIPFLQRLVNLDLQWAKEKQVCFICSWHRRKALFELANELNCNKIAFGHHLDDSIETLLLNMIFHGEICAMPVNLELFNGKMAIIRPMATITGHELERYAAIRGYKPPTSRCPYENESHRNEVRKIILHMSRLNKKAKQNLFRSMGHIRQDYLP